ncbi:PD-(D/E)XK nuclease family protein [Pseudorhodoplanes sp.]|uniref:PD-(D/E)XK nuclease family protein n=1 Tax=Pseudorhodoplanes sp. TaxID=1934341 RepID=UPI00391C13B2
MTVDLNSGSGFVYDAALIRPAASEFINSLIDDALESERAARGRRDYLGASRIGEPCARRLCFEMTGVSIDDRMEDGRPTLRVFEAGHVLEELSIRWLRAAGFDLRNRKRNGDQFGFEIAAGRIRGHIDGVIVNGPDLGLPWPILWEHKSASTKSWNTFVKRGLETWNGIYWGQVHFYMAYMELEHCLFTALNKDTLELHHELVAYRPSVAQALSDKAVDILRAVEAGELPPRIAAASDYYLCRSCPFARRCWQE